MAYVKCNQCGLRFDDARRSWVCPGHPMHPEIIRPGAYDDDAAPSPTLVAWAVASAVFVIILAVLFFIAVLRRSY